MTHTLLKQKALSLRRRGYSYDLIAQKIKVAQSTLSDWLAKEPYTPNDEVVRRIGLARANAGKMMTHLKRKSIEEASKLAREELGTLTKRDLFMLGIALYIGEGAKTTTLIRVANANPRIIKLAMRWFNEVCGVPKKNFLIRLHLYPDNSIENAKDYWSKIVDLPLEQFSRVVVDGRSNKKIGKRGKLPYGTAHLSVRAGGNILHGAFLRRKIDAWMDLILANA